MARANSSSLIRPRPEAPLNKRRGTGTLGLGVIELPSRPLNEYTLERLGCALQSVNSGSLRDAADFTRAAITQSGFVGGVLDTITSGIMGLPRTFVGGSPSVRLALDGDEEHRSEYDVLFPRAETKRVMAWGYTLGVGLGQFVDPSNATYAPPEQSEPLLATLQPDGTFAVQPQDRPRRQVGENRTPSLLAWDPRWLRWQWWDDTWHLMTAAGEIQIDPGCGEWLLFTPFGRKRPWEYGAWMSLVLAFIMLRDGVFDRGRHAEMLAPVRVGSCPEGTSEPQREEFARQIREMQRFPWFVLPPGLKYDVVEAKGAANITATYKDMIDWAEGDVMVRLTGNKVMVEGSPGFSKGDFQQRVTSSMRQSYARDWSDCARNQGISWWTADNYPGELAPSVEYNTDPPEDQDAQIKRIAECGKALSELRTGLDDVGFEIDDDEGVASLVARTAGLKIKRKQTSNVIVAKLDLAPTDIAKVVRVDEARASQQLPPIGDDRGHKMISELDAPGPAGPSPSQLPQSAQAMP